ncbi:MAG: lysozyme inhibitor LprI family protein [Acuticoccus sp.]
MPLISMRPVAGALLAAGLLAAPGALAQSFDCAKAAAADEKAVCASPALSRLDTQMADAYAAARRCAMMGMQGILLDEQRAFLAQRAACGADDGCLEKAYRARIRKLEADKAEIGQGAC